ncbi:hypothetical protein AOLI_G00216390 [Acnodon oligacanthus]
MSRPEAQDAAGFVLKGGRFLPARIATGHAPYREIGWNESLGLASYYLGRFELLANHRAGGGAFRNTDRHTAVKPTNRELRQTRVSARRWVNSGRFPALSGQEERRLELMSPHRGVTMTR